MIRSAAFTDFQFIRHLYFHPHINPFLLYEMEEYDHFEAIFDVLMAQKSLFIFELDGQIKGMFKLYPLAFRTSHIAYLGGVAIAPDQIGKGYGKLMLAEIVTFAKARKFTRLELSTATINHVAIATYEKVGFQQEGVMRNYTFLKSENRYIDEVKMAILFDS